MVGNENVLKPNVAEELSITARLSYRCTHDDHPVITMPSVTIAKAENVTQQQATHSDELVRHR